MSDTTLAKAYQLADQLKELAPWTYMDETDIFGVRMPDTGNGEVMVSFEDCNSVDAMHARFPDLLIKAILKLKAQPDTIELRHPLFYLMAKKALHPTKIKIALLPVLNQVEEVLKSMDENL